MPSLAQHRRVVAVDLRGMGGSAKPDGGYEKKAMVGDIAALIDHLGHGWADVVGEDVGAMVAQSLAVHHSQVVRRVVLGEGVHPEPSLAQLPLLPGDGTAPRGPLPSRYGSLGPSPGCGP
ncbi:alpha/beta fold hydrolase [Streptomyces sp. NPDC055025]